ncbi:WRKY transcription factor 25 [Hirschfeldia incana]|nr:WRKY transcription factor 25 [Hirschfeldia incana]
MSSTSFTGLLASSGVDFHEEEEEDFLGGYYPETTVSGLPKFKTAQPPPLPISQSFAFSDLLDSPLLLSSSHSLISPTTGAFPFQGFNGTNNHSDIPWQLQPQTQPSNASSALQETYVVQDLHKKKDPVPREFVAAHSFGLDRQVKVPSYMVSRNSNDGYGWRKYGQKQVKKSENPRSYFKCTYPNCVSKKIVETASDGQITEIIYKGAHNHPKPEFTRRPSGSTSMPSSSANARRMFNPSSVVSETHDQSENSSISFDYSDLEQKSFKSEYGEIDEEEEQPEIKRQKREGEDEGMSVEVSRGVKEPKVVVQTISDIDVLVDGFRWRKYGQKVVKGNTNPRSYYKCTYQGCGVRKQVERSAEDERAVLTTYEGRHNHDTPTALRRS